MKSFYVSDVIQKTFLIFKPCKLKCSLFDTFNSPLLSANVYKSLLKLIPLGQNLLIEAKLDVYEVTRFQ